MFPSLILGLSLFQHFYQSKWLRNSAIHETLSEPILQTEIDQNVGIGK